MAKKLALESIAAMLVLLFLYTALAKLLDHDVFAFQLHRMPYINGFADIIKWAVPICELFIIALLFSKKTRAAGFLSSVILLSFFTIYLSIALTNNQHLPCSCGGLISQLSWPQHVVFNITFIILGSYAYIQQTQKPSLNNQPLSWNPTKPTA